VPVREKFTKYDREADWHCISSLPSIALRDAVCCSEAVPSTQIDGAAHPEFSWIERMRRVERNMVSEDQMPPVQKAFQHALS